MIFHNYWKLSKRGKILKYKKIVITLKKKKKVNKKYWKKMLITLKKN